MKKYIKRLLTQTPLEIIIIVLTFLACLFAFSFIVHEAVYEREDLLDNAAIRFFAAHRSPQIVSLMETISFLGSSNFLMPAYIVVIIWQCTQKKYARALDIGLIGISSTALMLGLKQLFHRHRPALPVIKNVTGFSFPSGHSLSSFVFYTVLAYLVWQTNLPLWLKWLVTILSLVTASSIGMSRIALNVHYATDVIAGFCAGIVWVLTCFLLIRKLRKSATGSPATANNPRE